MRIAFIYRSYEGEMTKETFRKGPDGRPEYFDKRKCFQSFYSALTTLRNAHPDDEFELSVYHNKEQGKLAEYIKSQLRFQMGGDEGDVRGGDNWIPFETDPAQVLNNAANYPENRVRQHMTTKTVWSMIKEIDTDFIYVSEDDYLYANDSLLCLREYYEKFGDMSLVTLYDHLDRYTRTDDVTRGKEFIDITQSCHWRTCESTCHTFGMSKRIFDNHYDVINPQGTYRHDRDMYRTLLTRGVRLWSPIPGKITHMHPIFYSPCVDWVKINTETKLAGSAEHDRL